MGFTNDASNPWWAGPLTFPDIPTCPRETSPNLTRLLHKRGAAVKVDEALSATNDGNLGDPRFERFALVYGTHEFISGKFAGGGSPQKVRNQIEEVTVFLAWSDCSTDAFVRL